MHTKQKQADRIVLLDMGMTECFIHPETVIQLGIVMVWLATKLENCRDIRQTKERGCIEP
jgi:hypothetical protein